MLFIYSGVVPALDRRLRYELGKDHQLFTIPFAPEAHWAALEARDYFEACGINAHALSASALYGVKQKLRNEIFTSDAVYLTGGNTYQFLAYAREVGLFSMLQAFEALGGVIVAESAGSIILSPNISTAAIPTTCPDENSTGMTEFQAMGRIPFHVSPHYEPESPHADREMDELQTLADLSNASVLVLQDGAGVMLQGDNIVFSTGTPIWLTAAADQSHLPDSPERCAEQAAGSPYSLVG